MNSPVIAGRKVITRDGVSCYAGFIRVVDDQPHEILVETCTGAFLWLSDDDIFVESHLALVGPTRCLALVFKCATHPTEVALEYAIGGELSIHHIEDILLHDDDEDTENADNDLRRSFQARRHNEQCFDHSVSIEHCLVRYFNYKVNKFQTNTVIGHDQERKVLTICGSVANVVEVYPATTHTILEGFPRGTEKYTRRSRKERIFWEAFGLVNPDSSNGKVDRDGRSNRQSASKRHISPLPSSLRGLQHKRKLPDALQTPGESLSQPKKPCLAASDTVSTSTPQIILSEAVEFSDSNSFSEASTPSPMEVMPLSKSLITGNDTASSLLPVPESQYNRTDDQRLSSTGQFNGMHLRLPSGSVPSDSVEAESSVTSSSVPSNHPSLASISGGLFSDSFVSALMDQLTGDLTTLLQSNICHRLVDILKVASEARQRMRPSHQQACRPPPYVEGLVPSPASVDQAACVDLGSFATPSFASNSSSGGSGLATCGAGGKGESFESNNPSSLMSPSLLSPLVMPLSRNIVSSLSQNLQVFSNLEKLETEVSLWARECGEQMRLPLSNGFGKGASLPPSGDNQFASASSQCKRRRGSGAFPQELPCHVYPSKFSEGEGGVDRCRPCRENIAARRHTQQDRRSSAEEANLCAFVGFRKLHVVNGVVKSAGFCTVNEATNDKLQMFRAQPQCSAFTPDQGSYLLQCLRPVVLRLLQEELYFGNADEVCLKALGYREVCDICATTVFNTHFVCERCGAVVCLKCYQLQSDSSWKGKGTNPKLLHLKQSTGWKCTRSDHILLPTQVIPTSVLNQTYEQICKVTSQPSVRSPKASLSVSLLVDCDCVYLEDCVNVDMDVFRSEWAAGKPVVIGNLHHVLEQNWSPAGISAVVGPNNENADVVDCSFNVRSLCRSSVEKFWDGFLSVDARIAHSSSSHIPLLKLKDWPTKTEFQSVMPDHYADLMSHLPVREYTHHQGTFNLSARLPNGYVLPDLGPKMYISYGTSVMGCSTTNLHLDVSDAVNVVVYATSPSATSPEGIKFLLQDRSSTSRVIERQNPEIKKRCCSRIPGALWHIYSASDADKIREFLREHHDLPMSLDPIHDQCYYLHEDLRRLLREKKGVVGFEIIQCLGDAIFIPAGAPHQVQNLNSCIKVAEDFVSPEHIAQCVLLTDEFRYLTDEHTNHEDKLQVSSIIYHSVKEAVSALLPVAS